MKPSGCPGCIAGVPIRPCAITGELWHRPRYGDAATRCTAPPPTPPRATCARTSTSAAIARLKRGHEAAAVARAAGFPERLVRAMQRHAMRADPWTPPPAIAHKVLPWSAFFLFDLH